MPICPKCGSYFVRDPCPACADAAYLVGEGGKQKREENRPNASVRAQLASSANEGSDQRTSEPLPAVAQRSKLISPGSSTKAEKTSISAQIDQMGDTGHTDISELRRVIQEKDAEIKQLRQVLTTIKNEIKKVDRN